MTGWTKDLTIFFFCDFTFMHVYNYLIHSQEKEFHHDSLEAFKSVKAWKNFVDGLVMIVFLAELDPEFLPEKDDEEQIAVKLHFFLERQNQI